MFRISAVIRPGLALALVASCSPPSTPPAPAPDPQPTTDPGTVQPDGDQLAVSLGVAVDARDDRGAPRLVRTIAPRPARRAGMTADEAARDHLAALTPLWLSNQRPAELTTSNQQRLRNGAQIVLLRQQIDHVDIHDGELRVMIQPDGSLAAISGTVLATSGPAKLQSTAAVAVDHALDALYGAARSRPAVTDGNDVAGFRELSVAAAPDFRVDSARAKPELLVDGTQRTAVWNVELFADKPGFDGRVEPAARQYLIADDGRVMLDVDLTANDSFVYRVFADTIGARTPFDGALQSFNPHPTGRPDGSLPGPESYNLVVMEAFNGPRDPWLSTTATTTTGNNVDAFADFTPPAGFSPGDIRPEVRAGRTLNYRYDFTAEPLATPTQSKAAVVNLFYVTNWLHDWYYDSGFTEATRNGQVNNLGRGGVGGDPLIVRAQSNALGGSRDNANMSTPADGRSPVMNMFLWSGAVQTSLTTPTATPATAIFINGARNFNFGGAVVLADNATGTGHTACVPLTASVAGKIALVEYDNSCTSAVVVDNVKAAGAIGIIAAIVIPNTPLQTLTGSTTANLPGLIISNEDGQALKAALPVTVNLLRTSTIEADGDLDNAIVAHEWGHYLHHRLASCGASQQCRSMSEGWGDFVALHMTLRASDTRDGTFGAVLYALTAGGFVQGGALDPGYFGIRRYPYSRDHSKNPYSFRHIGDDNPLPSDIPPNPRPATRPNSEVHNAGTVWTQMLWEVYNVLIDEHGFTEARRRMSDYVVSGLLLTPPEATYTEARDAILAAASALDSDDMLLMAAAFAGRGAGTCALSPARNSATMTGVVESGTIVAKLATSRATLTDSGTPSDRDGVLEPGEAGALRITVANASALAAEDVVVTATTTTPGVTLGNPINAGIVAGLSQADIQIPVKIAASAPLNAPLDIVVQVTSSAGCGTGRLVVELHQRIGVPGITDTTDGLLAASAPEPGAPAASAAEHADGGVVAVRRAPRTSLDGLPVTELP